MKSQRYLRNTIGILLLALGLTDCNVGENIMLFLTPNYSGPLCLDLGLFKGWLKVRITNEDLEYRFRPRERDRLLHHAVELVGVRSQNPLNINLQGDIDSGQLNPNLYAARDLIDTNEGLSDMLPPLTALRYSGGFPETPR